MSRDHFSCPFCNRDFVLTQETRPTYFSSFNYPDTHPRSYEGDGEPLSDDEFQIDLYRCPSCSNTTIKLSGKGSQFESREIFFNPISMAQQFPEYIPEQIREDYEEACAIVNLSPKASATLSRRCLQGMIRDYWDVKDTNSLYHEIKAIKDKVDPNVKNVLDSLRQLGNIGAHPEQDINLIIDIEPGEAEQLITFIEYLLTEWYIKRHDTEQLLKNINELNDNKQKERNS